MSDDQISRLAAVTIPVLPKEHRKYQTMNLDDAYESGWFDCQKCIEDLSSTHQWTPISEGLPKNDDWVIVTILDERGDTPFKYTDFGWYLEEANCWVVAAEQRTDIIAWMPLPEPYKEKR